MAFSFQGRSQRRFKLFVIGIALVLPGILSAQPFVQRFNPFLVVQVSDTLLNPFSGGTDNPVHQFLDIDADDDLDLFVLDKDTLLALYKNEGNASAPRFILQSLRFQNLAVGSWFRFADIDGDGDFDLFANAPSATVRLYRNTGTKFAPVFALDVANLADSSGAPIRSEEISQPAFADLDGDGDLDFFSGNSSGVLWYYENIGSASNFLLRFVTDKFQNIQIVGGFNIKGPELPRQELSGIEERAKRLHGAMAIDFADIDDDGDMDLFWGDLFNQGLYFLRNNGTSVSPQLVLVDSTFADEAPVSSFGFNMPSFVDIDGDRDLDLFIGVLYFGASINNFLLYRNLGDTLTHQFQLQSSNVLPAIDVGAASSPTFTDIDGDGDQDLVVGGEQGVLAWFERKGIPQQPVFEFRSNQIVNVAGLYNISPTFGDVDGDAKTDLVLGDFNGRLRFYKKTDTAYIPTAFQLDSLNFGLNASPILVDIDGDTLLDLFVGTGGGRLTYFHNAGTPALPDFVLESSWFLSIDVGDDAKPSFSDLDSDGDFDLVIGSRSGRISYFRNTGSTTVSVFVSDSVSVGGIYPSQRSAPALSDIDGDGDVDFVIGNVRGGLYYYENARLPVGVRSSEIPDKFVLLQNYPNPFNARTNFEFRVASFEFVVLRIYDVLGRVLTTLVEEELEPGVHRAVWDATKFPSGVYMYRLVAGSSYQTKKMILMR